MMHAGAGGGNGPPLPCQSSGLEFPNINIEGQADDTSLA